jgi:hypothetical protein
LFPYGEKMNLDEMRLEALRLAVSRAESARPASEIVDDARIFYDLLASSQSGLERPKDTERTDLDIVGD